MKNPIFFLSGIFLIPLFFSCEKKIEFIDAPLIKENPNENAPLAAVLSFSSNKPVSIEVEFVSDDHVFSIELPETANTGRGLPLIGMKSGRNYEISLQLHSGGRKYKYEQTLSYSTPQLPDNPHKMLRFIVERNNAIPMEPGITLLNPRVRGQGVDGRKVGLLTAVDSTGDIIWYYTCPDRVSDFNFLPNRHISYMTADHRFVEIDLLGNIVRSWYASERPQGEAKNSIPVKTLTFHHDAYLLPNGNYLVLGTDAREIENYYTSEMEVNAPRKTQKVMGDVILEFTPRGEIVWEWNTFDHLDPMRIGYNTFNRYWYTRGYPGYLDWTHANTILYDSSDNTVIMNSRFLSSIIKINRDGSIKWYFGEPTGLSEELKQKAIKIINSEWFWHQHSISFTPYGTLLVFNNNRSRAWPFYGIQSFGNSFAVEYTINEEELTAEEIWTSKRPDLPGVESSAMGDVDYLDQTGNVLVSYGLIEPNKDYGRTTEWSMVREFTRENPAELAWELQLSPLENHEDSVSWVLFSAERIENFY